MSSVLSLTNIVRSYDQGGRALSVLHHLDLHIKKGEAVALVGPSGSGKSTLLQIAGLLDTPTSGAVAVGGENMSGAADSIRTYARRKYMGFVYQFHHLLPEFSALENVMLAQMIAGAPARQAGTKAATLLTSLGLGERLHHRPGKLSGGEQQRTAIARALINDPVLLLADEPTGNLDPITSEAVFGLMLRLTRERGMAALVATHNPDLARRMDRIVQLENGALK